MPASLKAAALAQEEALTYEASDSAVADGFTREAASTGDSASDKGVDGTRDAARSDDSASDARPDGQEANTGDSSSDAGADGLTHKAASTGDSASDTGADGTHDAASTADSASDARPDGQAANTGDTSSDSGVECRKEASSIDSVSDTGADGTHASTGDSASDTGANGPKDEDVPPPSAGATATLKATIAGFKDGLPSPSIIDMAISRGAIHHADGKCTPCPYLQTGLKCTEGVLCRFCHYPHGRVELSGADRESRGNEESSRPRGDAVPRRCRPFEPTTPVSSLSARERARMRIRAPRLCHYA